jgi:predicted flap endonuclease-1-like 5' DNA nuclease
MMAKLTEVEGIGSVYAQQLSEIGVETTEDLLKEGATPAGRASLAERSGISKKLILRWVNHVDLFRIKGIGSEYAEILEAAGVDTVPELAQRNPENLHAKLVEVNRAEARVRQLPAVDQIENWIHQAETLPRVVVY